MPIDIDDMKPMDEWQLYLISNNTNFYIMHARNIFNYSS